MPRPFSPGTAEQAVAVTEAITVRPGEDPDFVAEFCELTVDQADAALKLATDLGLLSSHSGRYSPASPLCRFLLTPNQRHKAAVLRVVLESYPPFLIFRERLGATTVASTAAQQTKAHLELSAHREEIKDTLVSLGTYAYALETEGGGRYRPRELAAEDTLEALAEASREAASSEARIRTLLAAEATAAVSREHIILPLANALTRASGDDARGAVVMAGNAVETYLSDLANRHGINIVGATGINAKLDRIAQAGFLPPKIVYVGKYLGHVRNAADHGVDADVGAPWSIRPSTGLEYVHIACSFLAIVTAREQGRPPEI